MAHLATGLTLPPGNWTQYVPPAPPLAPLPPRIEEMTPPPIAQTPPEPKVEPQKPVAAPVALPENHREPVPERGAVKTIWERFIDQIEGMAESSRFQGTMALIGVTAIGLTLLFVLASNPVGWLASAFALSYVAAKVIFIVGVYVAEALFLVGPFYVFDNQSTYKVETGNTRSRKADDPKVLETLRAHNPLPRRMRPRLPSRVHSTNVPTTNRTGRFNHIPKVCSTRALKCYNKKAALTISNC